MDDNRDFDLRNLPVIGDMLMSGVPESLDLSERLEELEADNTRAWMRVEAITKERDDWREKAEQMTAARLAMEGLYMRAVEEKAALLAERDEARKAHLAQKDALMYLEGLTKRLLQERQSALKERDAALALLAETWEWTTPYTRGKLSYMDLGRRVKAALAALAAKEEQP